MKLRHIIFDCDGVLVDSEPLSLQLDVTILAENGVTLSLAEAHRRFVGKTFTAMLAEMAAETGKHFPPGLSALKDRRLLELYATQLQAVTGVRDALLAINGAPHSIASNSPVHRVVTAIELTGLDTFFGNITTYEQVARGKPEPDVFIEAARRVGVSPTDCLVIEDSVTGVTAAMRAGCTVAGFTGTWAHPTAHGQRLKAAGAAHVFASMAELPRLVETAHS